LFVLTDHSHKHPPTKKEEIRARNKRHLIVNQLSELANEAPAASHSIAAPVGPIQAPVTSVSHEQIATSGNTRLDMIRNRISGRKRVAKDRWNRFAGTSGGGGRGL
jgi:hypothetical protein